MTDVTPTVPLVREFSDPDTAKLPWAEAVQVLVSSEMFWLSTVRSDGRPHVAPRYAC
ncbi:MAG: hypothetical protein QOK11_3814 [Pseudonocardiales bacterium]|nr:hypothetical protein [Pseudonocardiales bacterium]